jgi:hypothetical protein
LDVDGLPIDMEHLAQQMRVFVCGLTGQVSMRVPNQSGMWWWMLTGGAVSGVMKGNDATATFS